MALAIFRDEAELPSELSAHRAYRCLMTWLLRRCKLRNDTYSLLCICCLPARPLIYLLDITDTLRRLAPLRIDILQRQPPELPHPPKIVTLSLLLSLLHHTPESLLHHRVSTLFFLLRRRRIAISIRVQRGTSTRMVAEAASDHGPGSSAGRLRSAAGHLDGFARQAGRREQAAAVGISADAKNGRRVTVSLASFWIIALHLVRISHEICSPHIRAANKASLIPEGKICLKAHNLLISGISHALWLPS